MTKEEKAAYDKVYHKAYRIANKEKVLAYTKSYYQANKEKRKANAAAQMAANKHDHVVYYLPEHHYVGITNCLYSRLNNHRSRYNRVTEGYEIIYTAKDAVEARAVERYMHYEMGYNGQHRGTKGY